MAAGLLYVSDVRICSVVAFPLGANLPQYKAAETRGELESGATEIDMAINIDALQGEAYDLVFDDVKAVINEAHPAGAKVKASIVVALLNSFERILACLLSQAVDVDFVKALNGFGPSGTMINDVQLIRRVIGNGTAVKASGGIRTYEDALAMIKAGANRIGASASLSILQEAIAK